MAGIIGLIGIGNMGIAVAQRLADAFTVVGFDTSDERRAAAAGLGVEVAESVPEVASRADIVLLSLPRPAISAATVTSILNAPDRVTTAIVETSTVLPSDARAAAEACADQDVAYVDAAILSGVGSVLAGQTQLLIGGMPEAVEHVRPALNAITATSRWLGPVGAGMAAKVINNAVAHDVFVVLSEAVALGRANGIEIGTLVELLGDPEAGLIRPLTHRIAERLATRSFDGGMPIDAARKDSQLALAMAQEGGVALFATQAAHTVYEIAVAAGMGRLDYSAVATLWDGWRPRG